MKTSIFIRFSALILLFTLVCVPFGFTQTNSGQDSSSNKKGIAAADDWLALVDEKNYPGSWLAAAEIFRAAVSITQWSDMASSVRDPLGELLSRDLFHDQSTTSLPGMPDGHYLILRYATTFANKAKTVESITVMKEDDGTWRVAGYFIK